MQCMFWSSMGFGSWCDDCVPEHILWCPEFIREATCDVSLAMVARRSCGSANAAQLGTLSLDFVLFLYDSCCVHGVWCLYHFRLGQVQGARCQRDWRLEVSSCSTFRSCCFIAARCRAQRLDGPRRGLKPWRFTVVFVPSIFSRWGRWFAFSSCALK